MLLKIFSSSFWIHSLFYTFLQRFSLFFFGAISYIVMAHSFDPKTFAHWALFIVVLSLIDSAKNGLLRNPAIKFFSMPQYAARKNEVESSSFILNLIFSVSVSILLFTLGKPLSRWLQSEPLNELIPGGIIIILVNIFFSHFEMILQSKFKFAEIFKANFSRQFIFFLGVVVLSFFPNYFLLGNILLLQILGTILGTLMIYAFARPHQQKHFRFSPKLFLHMAHYGKYTFGTNLFSQAGRSFDQTLSAMLLDPVTSKMYVAYYNVVGRINNMMDVPSLAAADVSYPKNVEAVEDHGLEKVKYYFERMAGSILAIMLPISLVILLMPKLVLMIIGGKDYYPAAPLLQLALVFGWVRPISYQFGSVMDAIGKPQLNFRVNLLFFIVSLVLHLVFITGFGGIGGAIALACVYMLLLIVMMVLLKKHIGIEPRNIIKETKAFYKVPFRWLTGRKKAGD